MAKMTGKNLYDMADLYDVITMYIAGTKDQRNTWEVPSYFVSKNKQEAEESEEEGEIEATQTILFPLNWIGKWPSAVMRWNAEKWAPCYMGNNTCYRKLFIQWS